MNTIVHHQTSHQFITEVEGKIAHLDYTPSIDGKVLDYHHTFVPLELRGRHIAQDIVKFALEYAKANHFKIIPTCSFVERYIEQHPEYQSLVAS